MKFVRFPCKRRWKCVDEQLLYVLNQVSQPASKLSFGVSRENYFGRKRWILSWFASLARHPNSACSQARYYWVYSYTLLSLFVGFSSPCFFICPPYTYHQNNDVIAVIIRVPNIALDSVSLGFNKNKVS